MTSEDQRLAYEVERAIALLPNVQIRDVKVTVDDGLARVRGVVGTLAEKQRALEAASQVPGVRGVTEAIAVETPHPPRDRELSEAMGEALEAEEDMDAIHVGASAAGGSARLVGTAPSLSYLAHAAETVEEVEGAISTIDSSRIENPYGPDRVDLVNAIADAFRAHPVLRNRAIRALIEDTGRVVLQGEVRSDAEREEALVVASGIPGAHTIREELVVVP